MGIPFSVTEKSEVLALVNIVPPPYARIFGKFFESIPVNCADAMMGMKKSKKEYKDLMCNADDMMQFVMQKCHLFWCMPILKNDEMK
jgi:hypothetical protein